MFGLGCGRGGGWWLGGWVVEGMVGRKDGVYSTTIGFGVADSQIVPCDQGTVNPVSYTVESVDMTSC